MSYQQAVAQAQAARSLVSTCEMLELQLNQLAPSAERDEMAKRARELVEMAEDQAAKATAAKLAARAA